jgi:hypothetical protein
MSETTPAATYVRKGTDGCQWIGPDQDPRLGPVHYCGNKPLWPGRNYCEDHVWRVYQKGTGIGVSRKNKAIEKELALIKELEGVDRE